MTMPRNKTRSVTPPGFRPDTDDGPAMSSGVFALACAVVVVLFVFAAVNFGTSSIESDIETRANGLLAANDLDTVTAQASGTDVLLTGTVAEGTNQEAIFAAVDGLTGVTSVEGTLWEIATESGEEIVVTGDSIEIAWQRNVVTVTGDVSTEERSATLDSTLAEAFGILRTDGVNVVEGLQDESEWFGPVLGFVRTIHEQLDEGLLIVVPSQELVILSGEVPEKSERDDLNEQLTQLAADIGFDANPAVRSPDNTPTAEEVEALQVDLDALLEGKVVEFRVNSDEITEAGEELLDEILETIALEPAIRIEIAGHADSQGSPDANMELSMARAQAVLAYLVAHGEDAERFDVLAFGETQPIADNTTEEGRAKNRRIEFRALLVEEDDE